MIAVGSSPRIETPTSKKLAGASMSAGDVKYGVDLTPVEVCNEQTSLLGGDGGEADASTTSLLKDLRHDR